MPGLAELAAVALTVAALAVLLWGRWREERVVSVVAKPVASVGFLAVAALATPADPAYALPLRAGLVLSFLGDLCLISADRRWLLAGIAAFGGGHVAYCVAFAPLVVPGPVAGLVALPFFVGAGAVLWHVRHGLGALAVPATLYGVAVSATAALAVGAYASEPFGGGRTLLLAGGVLFFASDASVARQRFARSSFADKAWGLPCYYAAQLLLAASIAGVAA